MNHYHGTEALKIDRCSTLLKKLIVLNPALFMLPQFNKLVKIIIARTEIKNPLLKTTCKTNV